MYVDFVYLTNERLNFVDAQAFCESNNGTLPYFETYIEYQDFKAMKGLEYEWLGITKNATDNIWYTVEGSENTIFDWNRKQPDNWGANNENCIQVKGIWNNVNGVWNDIRCTETANFACRIMKLGKRPTVTPTTTTDFQRISDDEVDFETARHNCQAENMTLSFFKNFEEYEIYTAQGFGAEWIGIKRDTEDSNLWINVDSSPSTVLFWTKYNNNPDNLGGNENCVEFEDSGLMNDLDCSKLRKFSCRNETLILP